MARTTRIPTTCTTLDDVAQYLANHMNVAEVHIEVIDSTWGIGEVFVVDGMDLEYVGRLDDATFMPGA